MSPPEQTSEFHTDRLTLRRTTEDDVPALFELISQPSVARWWAPTTAERLRDELFADGVVTYTIHVDGALAGLIQYGQEPDPGYRHASIDLALGDGYQDRGLGAEAIRLMASHLFNELGHHRITIDPEVSNRRAIACYTKVGFRPVGVMRKYSRAADGTWHDGLLMDLLAEELNDTLVGDRGDDKINGGRGRDHVKSGPGNDRIRVRDGKRDVVSCDTVTADRRDKVGESCEHVNR